MVAYDERGLSYAIASLISIAGNRVIISASPAGYRVRVLGPDYFKKLEVLPCWQLRHKLSIGMAALSVQVLVRCLLANELVISLAPKRESPLLCTLSEAAQPLAAAPCLSRRESWHLSCHLV